MINFWFYDTFCTLLSVPSSSAMNWVYIRGNSRVRMNEKPHMLWFEKFVTSKPPSSLCWTRIFRNVNENQRRLLRILTLVQHVVVRRWWTHWRCTDGKFIIYDSSEENWKLSRLHFPPWAEFFQPQRCFSFYESESERFVDSRTAARRRVKTTEIDDVEQIRHSTNSQLLIESECNECVEILKHDRDEVKGKWGKSMFGEQNKRALEFARKTFGCLCVRGKALVAQHGKLLGPSRITRTHLRGKIYSSAR